MKKCFFILKDCGHDEYPGDGLRLVGYRWAAERNKEVCNTDLLRYLGFDDLKADDMVEITVAIKRSVPTRESVEIE